MRLLAGMMDLASVDIGETPLADRGPRSMPVGGGFYIVLGALMVGFGLSAGFAVSLVALFTAGGLPREQRWLIPPALLFMILVGIGLVRAGLADRRRVARAEDLAARHPDQPWLADAHWDP